MIFVHIWCISTGRMIHRCQIEEWQLPFSYQYNPSPAHILLKGSVYKSQASPEVFVRFVSFSLAAAAAPGEV